jgi:hypothetical protein
MREVRAGLKEFQMAALFRVQFYLFVLDIERRLVLVQLQNMQNMQYNNM